MKNSPELFTIEVDVTYTGDIDQKEFYIARHGYLYFGQNIGSPFPPVQNLAQIIRLKYVLDHGTDKIIATFETSHIEITQEARNAMCVAAFTQWKPIPNDVYTKTALLFHANERPEVRISYCPDIEAEVNSAFPHTWPWAQVKPYRGKDAFAGLENLIQPRKETFMLPEKESTPGTFAFTLNETDREFLEEMNKATEDIIAAYGIPRQELGMTSHESNKPFQIELLQEYYKDVTVGEDETPDTELLSAFDILTEERKAATNDIYTVYRTALDTFHLYREPLSFLTEADKLGVASHRDELIELAQRHDVDLFTKQWKERNYDLF